jgi:hypothetical protein
MTKKPKPTKKELEARIADLRETLDTYRFLRDSRASGLAYALEVLDGEA